MENPASATMKARLKRNKMVKCRQCGRGMLKPVHPSFSKLCSWICLDIWRLWGDNEQRPEKSDG